VRRVLLCLAIGGSVLLAACTSSGTDNPTVDTTSTHTATKPPAQITYKPKPAKTVAPLPPGQAPAKGEVEKACPYIASTPEQNPNVNVADIEGDHVYRTTVLTGMKPVGCHFYFYAGPYEAVADITTQRFGTALDAHNAMVLTGQAGQQVQGKKDGISAGIDAVIYKTKFYGPDGNGDWACAFAKGKIMVIVHTQQTNVSVNALYLAQAIAPKI
jgi:hypothetical protein